MNVLPENDAERGEILMADCLLDYFPNALAAVAVHSKRSNDKHNPGESAHWARDKSTDHRNKIIRHTLDAGGFDKNGDRHSAALAWRALANLEDELIAAGAVPGRNAIGAPAPKDHRRVAPPAEMAAYRDNGPAFPPYSHDNWPQKGHRVRLLSVNCYHGARVGEVGTVDENSRAPYVTLDSGRTSAFCYARLERIA